MKKINFLIVIFVSVVLFLASCNKIAEKSSLYKNLKAETDSLIVESQMRNADLVDICK